MTQNLNPYHSGRARMREVGLPGRTLLVKVGVKRLLVVMMFSVAKLVWAESVSVSQDVISLSQVQTPPVISEPQKIATASLFYGSASWYSESDPFVGRFTANGDIFDDSKFTCASWHFPFGTRLKITNVENGESVICTVNDRGPAKRLGRLIDLTLSAFRAIADPKKGIAEVSVTAVLG